jgi:hypothetical protein
MHQMQQEQKQRLTALCALETAVMSSEAQGADALLSLRGQPLTPNGGSTTSSIAICPPCTTPNEELRAALKNISRFRSRCKPTEAEGVLQQLLDDGSHSSATPSATAKAMEDWLVSAGGMQMATAVLSCFMKRPAVRAVQSQVQELENAEVEAMKIMIETAHSFLEKLKTNGNNYDEDENAIRVLLSALVPSGDITQMVSIFSRLLGMSRHRIMQGNKTQPTVSEEKCAGWTRVVRAEYKNKIDLSFASSRGFTRSVVLTQTRKERSVYTSDLVPTLSTGDTLCTTVSGATTRSCSRAKSMQSGNAFMQGNRYCTTCLRMQNATVWSLVILLNVLILLRPSLLCC